MLKILHVVGARPNFMKCDPVIRAMRKARGFRQTLVHTGQHYDDNMSKVFFDELGIRKPDIDLGVGRKARTESTENTERECQVSEIMKRFEPVLLDKKPNWVFVYGDVNSTVACARVAAQHGVKVAHVEAGLRSFDRKMPEELNRIETDKLADLLFVTEKSGLENLKKEGLTGRAGRSGKTVHLVGNTMIDTLVRLLPKARRRFPALCSLWPQCETSSYALVTLHRPSNVDDPKKLRRIMRQLERVAETMPVLFPVHPRTAKLLAEMGYVLQEGREERERSEPSLSVPSRTSCEKTVQLLPPAGYLDFLSLQANAAVVITDSGGIQEETTHLGVPCLTVRTNTERPVTIEKGTNRLIRIQQTRKAVDECTLKRKRPRARIPKWDGSAADRIAETMGKL